jgi:hypothetical protein
MYKYPKLICQLHQKEKYNYLCVVHIFMQYLRLKVKLSLHLIIKHYTMKTFEGGEL